MLEEYILYISCNRLYVYFNGYINNDRNDLQNLFSVIYQELRIKQENLPLIQTFSRVLLTGGR